MSFRLEANRFYMRELTANDAQANFEMNNDFEVIQYTGDVAFESLEASKEFWSNYDPYAKYGVGRYAVCDIDTNEFMGWCGVKFHPETGLFDLGYRFKQKYWGKGIATESSYLSLKYAFEVLGIQSIYAQAMKCNPASIHVMEKLGMVYTRDEKCGTEEGVVYEITKEQFQQLNQRNQ
jgi:RimJ/RimL family protein N-acetyltransferase